MEGSRWGIKYNKNKREEERDRERERRKIKREFIEEGEGSNIIPLLGAAAPIRRGAGAEKGEEYSRLGLGWWTMLYKERSRVLQHTATTQEQRGKSDIRGGEGEGGRR